MVDAGRRPTRIGTPLAMRHSSPRSRSTKPLLPARASAGTISRTRTSAGRATPLHQPRRPRALLRFPRRARGPPRH
eukprot:11435564-Alexandrium_andersonii.AAC.1